MERLWRYYGNVQSLRGEVGGLPGWARSVLLFVALPGIAAIVLSILAFLVSLSALLLMTVPLYRLLKAVTVARTSRQGSSVEVLAGDFPTPGRKRVDATVVEPAESP
jgi:hypothetical protein